LDKKEKGRLYGVFLKNHFYPTSPLIKSAGKTTVKMFGSVVLNNFVGGFNKEAIYAASLLTDSPIMVWFPTTSAAQFLKSSKYEIPPEWTAGSLPAARQSTEVNNLSVTGKKGSLKREVLEVLRMIKQTKSILATGHISWEESVILVKEAKQLGIEKIIITHPIYQRINMPVEIQKQLASLGARIEMCYSMYSIDDIPMEKIADQIRMIGPENCILSSDVGQKFSPSPSEALLDFSSKLYELGISLKEIELMLVKNPRVLVNN
jgi:hypothetical protein